jgi:pyroglutamyl-peptidase
MSARRPLRIAVAGFGPFPGVRKNPSAEIVRAIAKSPRLRRADLRLDTAIFPTAYEAAKSGLDKLVEKHPDAIVLFGVAARTKHIRIERIAHNRASLFYPDSTRFVPRTRKLLPDGAPRLPLRGPATQMRAAIRATGAKAELSVNAGSYLCNAVFYQALAATAAHKPAPLTFFIHVPSPKPGCGPLSLAGLIRAGEAAVCAAASAIAVSRRDT